MDKKKAFVLDTNFIVENIKLLDVVEKLSDDFTIYVPQICIEERKSQKYRELQSDYYKLYEFAEKVSSFATITKTKSFEEKHNADAEQLQNSYDKNFVGTIIPFAKDEETFIEIWDRIYKKLPPFKTADPKSSDKGFKDSLLWLAILRFFKDNGEDNVILVTNDTSFHDGKEFLEKEFAEYTSKSIDIRTNDFYREIIRVDELPAEAPPDEQMKSLPNLKELRKEIGNAIYSFCNTRVWNDYGDDYNDKTFLLSSKVPELFVDTMLNKLHGKVKANILNSEIMPDIIMDDLDCVVNKNAIPIDDVENLLVNL